MIPAHPLSEWWRKADGFDGPRTSSGMPIIMHTRGNKVARLAEERDIFARHEMALRIAQAVFGWLR